MANASYDPLIELIKNKWDKLNIGVEMDSHYFTAYCYEKLKQGLPNAKIKIQKDWLIGQG